MLVYSQKRLVIGIVAAMVAYFAVSTVWAAVTGTVMGATVAGLILSFVVFFGTMGVTYKVLDAKTEDETEAWTRAYDDDCDPSPLVKHGAALAEKVVANPTEQGGWFAGEYAQALIDTCQPNKAKALLGELESAASSIRSDKARAAFLTNLVPVAMKLGDYPKTVALANEALALCGAESAPEQSLDEAAPDVKPADEKVTASAAPDTRIIYLQAEKALAEAWIHKDYAQVIDACNPVRGSDDVPMRLRVSRTWMEAQACEAAGEGDLERVCLKYVLANGNVLACVMHAHDRMNYLNS